MKFWRLHRPGYRVLKTVIATTLTLLVCSRFSKMSPVLALMGAYCAMGRTIRESWTGCLNQMVGVLVGSVFGFLLLHVLPDPPALVIGLSLFAVIGLCNLLHVSYAVFLSSVIFISVCSGASQLPDILARVRDVSIGLAFGLAVNIFVHPYANERQVLALLENAAIPEAADKDWKSVADLVMEDHKGLSCYSIFAFFREHCPDRQHIYSFCTQIVKTLCVNLYGFVPLAFTDNPLRTVVKGESEA